LCQLPINGIQIIGMMTNNQGSGAEAVGGVVGILIGACCGLILVPIFMTIYLYILSGLFHLALMILGGAKEGFEATMRVCSYSIGAMSLPNAIPCVNCLTVIYMLVLIALGLHKAHKCEIWQSVVAIVLVVALCIGSIVVLYIMFIAAIIAMISAA
jgi:hypothetical protein